MLPDAGDPLLVEQERLDRLLAPARERAQGLRGEVGAERLHAEARLEVVLQRVARRAGRRRCRSGARRRTAGGARRRGSKRHAQVRRVLGVLGEQQVARHAQVHDQVDVVLERQDQVLAAPADALDQAAAQRVRDRLRRRRLAPARRRAPRTPRCAGPPARAPAGGGSSRPRGARARPPDVTATRRARVRLEVDVLQPLAREVRVQLGGRHVGVAEHLLHRAQVAAAGEQVGRERVAQRVRAHAVGQARRDARGGERSCRGPGG